MTPDNPSLIDSSTTMLDDNQASEKLSQEEAEELLTGVFQDGAPTIKRMIQLIWDQGRIDLEAVYRQESTREENFRKRHRLPALNLPTWEEIAPTQHLASSPKRLLDRKRPTLSVSEMLTPSELAQLKQAANAFADSAAKAFPGLKILR